MKKQRTNLTMTEINAESIKRELQGLEAVDWCLMQLEEFFPNEMNSPLLLTVNQIKEKESASDKDLIQNDDFALPSDEFETPEAFIEAYSKEVKLVHDPIHKARVEFIEGLTDEDLIDYVTGNATKSLEEEIELLMEQDLLLKEEITSLRGIYLDSGMNIEVLKEACDWSRNSDFSPLDALSRHKRK